MNIKEIVSELSGLFEQNLQQKKIKLDYMDCTNCDVVADKKMVNTIIRNLVSNAIKFTPEGGKITITGKEVDSKYEISVQDTGVGIPEDKLDKLFDPAGNHSTLGTKKEKGTGLGLILCKEFVEVHNGELSVESEVGKGTTFSFTLAKANVE